MLGPGRLVGVRLAHRGRAPARGAVGARPTRELSVARTGTPGAAAAPGSAFRPLRGQDGRRADRPDGPASPTTSRKPPRLADELGLGPGHGGDPDRRGLGDPAAARAFLAGGESHRARRSSTGWPRRGDLIGAHVEQGTRIAVFGDYDVDGVCSTAIMVRALRASAPTRSGACRAETRATGSPWTRCAELREQGARLLITVDCGITAVAEVAAARRPGMDVIVTDHHRPGDELPDCTIVHPGLGGGPRRALRRRRGAQAVRGAARAAGLDPTGADDDLDLAGLATVCDMVPLHGENRRIAREGLAALGPHHAARACGR